MRFMAAAAAAIYRRLSRLTRRPMRPSVGLSEAPARRHGVAGYFPPPDPRPFCALCRSACIRTPFFNAVVHAISTVIQWRAEPATQVGGCMNRLGWECVVVCGTAAAGGYSSHDRWFSRTAGAVGGGLSGGYVSCEARRVGRREFFGWRINRVQALWLGVRLLAAAAVLAGGILLMIPDCSWKCRAAHRASGLCWRSSTRCFRSFRKVSCIVHFSMRVTRCCLPVNGRDTWSAPWRSAWRTWSFSIPGHCC